MAYSRKTYKGVYEDTNAVYVCDTESDLSSLPTDAPHGSSAFVIENSKTYMINTSGTWAETSLGNSGGGGSVTLTTLNVSANGTRNAPSGVAYNKVVTNVSGGAPADPTDGKTHIWIRIDEDTPTGRQVFPLGFSQSDPSSVTVNWGDGSAEQVITGPEQGVPDGIHNHIYRERGEFEITLNVTSGEISFETVNGVTGMALYGSKANAYSYNRARILRVCFGNGVAGIGAYMLQYCYSAKYITMPSNATSVGNGAFHSCYSLVKADIPSGVTSIGESAFYYCYAMESVSIPSGVTTIGENAFYNCYALKSITIPSGVTVLDQYVLHGCHNLTSVTIPSGVTQISAGALDSCYGLTELTVPASVTSIGASAFSNCFGIKEYHMQRTTPPTLSGSSAFTGIASDCVIYVPYSADHSVLNAYKSATNWATYASKMQEEAQS